MNFFTRKGQALLVIAVALAVGTAGWLAGCGGDSGVADNSGTKDTPVTPGGGKFTDDRDGKSYKTVKIGEQTWMAENLNIETDSSWCYENADSNCVKYGRLYDWETAMEACPAGWHLSSTGEWGALMRIAGGQSVAGKKLKAKNGWNNYKGASGNGTDEFGFSALPGGYRSSYDGSFGSAGNIGYWWVDGEDDRRYYYWLRYDDDQVRGAVGDRLNSPHSVRCVED
jgi:uncharacterized protein (TIGR02145 family)